MVDYFTVILAQLFSSHIHICMCDSFALISAENRATLVTSIISHKLLLEKGNGEIWSASAALPLVLTQSQAELSKIN